MGFDVHGKSPSSDEGKFFRANIYDWTSVTEAVQAAGIPLQPGWEDNCGAGYDEQEDCDYLADKLDEFLRSGKTLFVPKTTVHGARTVAFVKFMESAGLMEDFLKNLPYKEHPTQKSPNGEPARVITIEPEDIPQEIRDGITEKDIPTEPMNKELVQEFVGFLRHCGGFEIW